jgi:hypothetical protein
MPFLDSLEKLRMLDAMTERMSLLSIFAVYSLSLHRPVCCSCHVQAAAWNAVNSFISRFSKRQWFSEFLSLHICLSSYIESIENSMNNIFVYFLRQNTQNVFYETS